MDALISDCDGVIVDSEPIHLAGFEQVLAERGVTLTRQAYYDRYLGFDDHDCFAAVGADNGRTFSQDEIAEMTAAKTRLVQKKMHADLQPMPGFSALVAALDQAGVPMAICSGGLRDEVELAAVTAGVRDVIETLVCAEDVQVGKPDPEGYRLALSELTKLVGRELQARRTVVLEDSPAGIAAAKALGMAVLAVASSYPPEALHQADRVVDSLANVTADDLEALLP